MRNNKMRNFLMVSVAVIILAVSVIAITSSIADLREKMGASSQALVHPTDETRYIEFFVATTTNATSTTSGAGYATIRGAEKVTFLFQRTGRSGNEGSSLFKVQVASSTVDWIDYGNLIPTYNAGKYATTTSISGTTTVAVSMDLTADAFPLVRCIVVETTDGEHTCASFIDF